MVSKFEFSTLSPPDWQEFGSRGWQRRVLDEGLREGPALLAADWDADGREEIIAGWRGGGLAMYRATDHSGSPYQRVDLDRNVAIESAVAADLNGDGMFDLVVVAGRSNKVAWYENVTSMPGPAP